jgi:hypothetical protein
MEDGVPVQRKKSSLGLDGKDNTGVRSTGYGRIERSPSITSVHFPKQQAPPSRPLTLSNQPLNQAEVK